jgi:hypothetical protein
MANGIAAEKKIAHQSHKARAGKDIITERLKPTSE